MNYPVDIIIPVWNRPLETRATLASLVKHSPQARIIMINNGSDRETEKILEEFAGALDERAILVSSVRNVGRVAALNRGLELAAAPVLIIVREGINVREGWLDPLLKVISERPDAGLLVPFPGKGARASDLLTELDHGSFDFMAIRRELAKAVGVFHENMDAGIWCLRDYSRRAEKSGFRTFACESAFVSDSGIQEFGSACRRKERIRQGELSYCSRWGEHQKFCIVFNGNEDDFHSRNMMQQLLTSARQGSKVVCITGNRLYKWLKLNQLTESHKNLTFIRLPAFFASRALHARIRQTVNSDSEIIIVNAAEAIGDDMKSCTLEDFSRMLEIRRSEFYL